MNTEDAVKLFILIKHLGYGVEEALEYMDPREPNVLL